MLFNPMSIWPVLKILSFLDPSKPPGNAPFLKAKLHIQSAHLIDFQAV